ncbi:TIGR04282 family arsenosugar biosynthesis glycosyltransferase [Cupriavidus laharis]|uniref:TIGR04282 family arsenosugar biosynthesis glycosyltransferase n=1 Tax=Cupriavidus laharis TaxID=151654 RepID=UPI00209691C0|nr:TIGR04282 family arsenosugar biosynthesis glycosyltransferase [Cupriavidus laharis]
MAKAPEPGYAKTRLIPALGAYGAAALAERLLRHTLASACAAEIGPVELCCTPDTGHPAFLACARDFNVALSRQCDGDLGQRMATTARRALARAGSVLIIGTDCPALEPTQLNAAARILNAGNDAVLVPAADGGYVLLGLRRLDPHLFSAIRWSTATVMTETRKRLTALGWRWAELPALPDVDEPGDLRHVPIALLSAGPKLSTE